MHCAFDWLGKIAATLLTAVGLLYGSSYLTGWPDLPDPDTQYRRHHGEQQRHDCRRDTPLSVFHAS